MTEVAVQIQLRVCYCATCSMPFGILPDFLERRRADHVGFFCPNGHRNVYNAKTNEDILRDKLRAEGLARELAEKRAAAAMAEKRRIKTRVAAGTCPCCNRTFSQLARHMKAKHPKELT